MSKAPLQKINRPPLPKNWGDVHYTDGSLSRELDEHEEDWEATGQDEMNELYEQCKNNHQASSVSLRDHVNRVHSMVEVCVIALLNPDWRGEQILQIKVADVLNEYVAPELENIEEELKYI